MRSISFSPSSKESVCIYTYEDGSVLIECKDRDDYVSISLSEVEHTRLAAFFEAASTHRLYVVKSAAGYYMTFGACHPFEDEDEDYRQGRAWTEERARAAHFMTKEAARAVAKTCHKAAGARVVRVKL